MLKSVVSEFVNVAKSVRYSYQRYLANPTPPTTAYMIIDPSMILERIQGLELMVPHLPMKSWR